MKLLTILPDHRLGIHTGAGVIDTVAANVAGVPTTIESAIAGGAEALAALQALVDNPPVEAIRVTRNPLAINA